MIAYLLAGGVILLTVAIYGFAHAPGPRYGPDAAGLELFYLMVCPLRWLLLAALLYMTAQRGGFAWISRQLVIAGAIVLAVHAVSGVLSIASFMALRHGGAYPQVGSWVFGYVMPCALVAYALVASAAAGAGAPVWARGLATALAAVTLAGGVLGLIGYRREQAVESARVAVAEQERTVEEAHQDAEERARVDSTVAAVHALPADAPLSALLVHMRSGYEEVRTVATQAVDARPRRDEELAALLATDDRVLALEYLWWHFDKPPAALAAPLRASIETMPDWTERTLATNDEEHATLVSRACEAIVVLADRYADTGLDFRGPIQRLHEFMRSRYNNASEFRGAQLLDGWLGQHR